METTSPRLIMFSVKGLYGEFDHVIPLNVEQHVTAIIAPNGMGKTLCLKLIQALFNGDWNFFHSVYFDSLNFSSDDKTEIIITQERNKNFPLLEDGDRDNDSKFIVNVRFVHNDIAINWHADIGIVSQNYMSSNYPYMRRRTNGTWVDTRDGEVLTERELVIRFSPPLKAKRRTSSGPPDSFSEYISKIHCKLIETQRLIVLDDIEDDRRGLSFSGNRTRMIYAISQKADSLKRIILSEINKYANLSQSLDRTFPQRVIKMQDTFGVDNIKDKLISLDDQRKQLMEVGILDPDENVQIALPDADIDAAIARVLSVYADDNEKKLNSLSSIYQRVSLFKELMTERFGSKSIEISKSDGVRISYGGNEVPLDRLSSGEQHQLVLFFELLFEIKTNTLILIDEPEISLHVAWQKKFISDLIRIIELNKFDVMLATHSPQLIGGWTNLVVELGDVN